MSNHVHYLLEPEQPEDLPKIMYLEAITPIAPTPINTIQQNKPEEIKSYFGGGRFCEISGGGSIQGEAFRPYHIFNKIPLFQKFTSLFCIYESSQTALM